MVEVEGVDRVGEVGHGGINDGILFDKGIDERGWEVSVGISHWGWFLESTHV